MSPRLRRSRREISEAVDELVRSQRENDERCKTQLLLGETERLAKERDELRLLAEQVVDEWHRWQDYLEHIGVRPELRGIARFVAALRRLEREAR